MAKATAHCTCENCGKEFIKTENKRNRKEAEDWIAWAESHITLCPECYNKAFEERINKQLEGIIGELTGTEKQISYAKSLLCKVTNERVAEAQKILEKVDDNVINTMMKKTGKTKEEVLRLGMKNVGYLDVYMAMTCTSAGEIIETLK